MRKGKAVAAAVLICLALAGATGCDESAIYPYGTPTPRASVQSITPLPTLTEEPTVTPLPTPTPPAQTPMPTVSAAHAAASATEGTASPVPLSAFDGRGSADLTGDGRRDTVLLAPSSETGTAQLMLNGLIYDTGIPAGDETTLYVQDINADGACEIIGVQKQGRGAALRIYRLTPQGLAAASFTYTVPAELSETGQDEYRENSETLVFSGIEPIVSLGDGSFAVLSFGSGFNRYVLGSDMLVREAGSLPVDILTGGEIPAMDGTAETGEQPDAP